VHTSRRQLLVAAAVVIVLVSGLPLALGCAQSQGTTSSSSPALSGATSTSTATAAKATDDASTTPSPSSSVGPLHTTVLTGRQNKVNLIEHLPSSPQTVIFGSSRTLKFESAYVKKLTGRRTFNSAVSSGRPIDEWCFQQLIRKRFPHANYKALIMLDVEQMLGDPTKIKRVPDDLLYVPALTQFLPPELLKVPPLYAAPRADDEKYTTWGFAYLGHYDIKERQGMTEAKWMPGTLQYFGHKYPGGAYGPALSSVIYLRKLISELNSWGTTPVVALTPYNTQLLSFIKARGWQKWHDMTVNFVKQLRDKEHLKLVFMDFSYPSSVGGNDTEFYDGYHPRTSLTEKMIRVVLKRSGRVLF
jgi:hypothetical protein